MVGVPQGVQGVPWWVYLRVVIKRVIASLGWSYSLLRVDYSLPGVDYSLLRVGIASLGWVIASLGWVIASLWWVIASLGWVIASLVGIPGYMPPWWYLPYYASLLPRVYIRGVHSLSVCVRVCTVSDMRSRMCDDGSYSRVVKEGRLCP